MEKLIEILEAMAGWQWVAMSGIYVSLLVAGGKIMGDLLKSIRKSKNHNSL